MARQTANGVHLSPPQKAVQIGLAPHISPMASHRRRNPETGKAVPRHRKSGLHGLLAQLVEQRTVNPLVAGSSPAGGAIWDSSLRGRSTGLKNRRMKARHLPVPPFGAIDESAKSPASQAGGCEFKSHWHHHPCGALDELVESPPFHGGI